MSMLRRKIIDLLTSFSSIIKQSYYGIYTLSKMMNQFKYGEKYRE